MAIEIEVLSNSKQARKDLSELNAAVASISETSNKAANSFKTFASGIATSIASSAAIATYIKLQDGITNLETRLRLATTSQIEFNRSLDDTRRISLTTRQSLESVTGLYSKIAVAAKNIGASQRDISTFTEDVAKSLAISGTSAQEASSAILQLGQAMASGRLQGDELRSILENAPALAKSIADGLNISIGKMRLLGAEGRIGIQEVFKAVLSQTDQINKNFSKVGVTYAQAFTNLGTAFTILFAGIAKTFSTSTGGLAAKINDIALRISSFGKNFGFEILKIDTKLSLMALNFSKVLYDIPDTFKKKFSELTGLKLNIDIQGTKLDIMKFIPNLTPALDIITNWVYVAERAFFWLYDRVIGHSWIPDLVEGVILWINKLGPGPLVVILAFAAAASAAFASPLKVLAPLAVALGSITTIATSMSLSTNQTATAFSHLSALALSLSFIFTGPAKSILFVTGAIAGLISSFGGLSDALDKWKASRALLLSADPVANESKWVDGAIFALDKLRSTITSLAKPISDIFGSSTIGHFTKQVLGMHETISGNYANPTSKSGTGFSGLDTRPEAKVGRGPQRTSENRTPLHDVINAIPVTWQIPALGAVAAVISGGILLAVKSPDVRSVMFGLLTTAFGIGVAQIVDDKEIKRFSGSVADNLRKALVFATEGLFGKGIFGEKDPASIIALIAKLSLLFKSGREFMAGKAIALATAPTSIGTQAATMLEAKRAKTAYDSIGETIAKAPENATIRMERARKNLDVAIGRLARSTDLLNTGDKVGYRNAEEIANGSNKQVGGIPANINAILAKRAAAQFELTREQLKNLGDTTDALKEKHAALGKNIEALNKQISESKAAFKAGVINTSAGIGGTLGSLYGFNLGNQIADSLTNATGWQKVGVTIATSMIGQGIGAGIGATIGQGIVVSLGVIGAILSNPFVIGAALVAGAIYAAFEVWSNWKWFESAFDKLGTILRNFLVEIGLLRSNSKLAKDGKLNPNTTIDGLRAVERLTGQKIDEIGIRIAKRDIDIANIVKPSGNTNIDNLVNSELIRQLDSANEQEYNRILDNTKAIISSRKALDDFADGVRRVPERIGDALLGIFSNMSSSLKNGAKSILDAVIPSANASDGSGLQPTIPTGIGIPNVKPDLTDPSIKAAKLSRIAEIKKAMDDLFQKIDPADRVKTFLESITNFEGANFDTNFGGSKISDLSRHPNEPGQFKLANGKTTSAAGAFQFQRGTWDALAKKNDLPDFKPDSQIVGALDLIKQAGAMADILAGNFSAASDKLGKIWEGLPSSDKFALNMNAWETAPKKLTTAIDAIKNGTAKVSSALGSQAVKIEKATEDTVNTAKDGIQGFIDNIMKSSTKSPAEFFDALKKMLSGGLARMGGNANGKPSTEIKDANPIEPVVVDTPKLTDKLSTLPDAGPSIIAINDALAKLSVPLLNISSFDKIDPDKIKTLAESIDNVQEIEKAIVANTGENQNRIGAIALANLRKNSNAFKAKAKEIIDDLNTGDIIGNKIGRSALAEQAGTSFAKSFQEDFGNKVSQMLQGKIKFRDGLASMLDSVSSQIIDTFVKGFVDSFFDRFSIKRMLEDQMANMSTGGETLAKAGSGAGSSSGGIFSALAGFVSKAWDGITSLFSSSSTDTTSAVTSGSSTSSSTTGKNADTTPGINAFGSVAGDLSSSSNSCCCGGQSGGIGKSTEGIFSKAWKSLKETLSGAWDSLKGTLSGAWDGLKGMLSGAWDGISSVFSGLPDMLSGAWDGLTSSLSGVFDGFSGSFSGLLDGLSGSLSGIMDSLGGMTGGGGGGGFDWASIAAMFMADGGFVSGPGSARSDSVPAMLSNGEFVVNAASTKKFGPLLNAINTGKIGKFADGGQVGNSVLTMPIDTTNRKDMTSSNQTGNMKQEFHINITGDISRQTRSEIQKMIPQIATGVNIHNYEQGRGRRS